jgi:hypothetical protein
MHVSHGAGAGKPGIDVDDGGTAGFAFHHPLEAHRMGFGHVRTHDDDAVGVREVLLVVGGAATAEGRSQTGNSGGVSNARLVLDLHRA